LPLNRFIIPSGKQTRQSDALRRVGNEESGASVAFPGKNQCPADVIRRTTASY